MTRAPYESVAAPTSHSGADRITVVSPDVQFAQSCFTRTESRFAQSMKLFRPGLRVDSPDICFLLFYSKGVFFETVNRFAMIDHYL